MPADVEQSRYGFRLSALVGLLGSAFPLSFSKTQALVDRLLGVEISCAAIPRIRERLSAALEQPMEEAIQEARLQPVAFVAETDAPTGNADGGHPDRKRGWQWVMMTPVVTVFLQGLSRSAVTAIELLWKAFAGIVVSDRFSAYNHLANSQRQLCWAHLIRDLNAIAERQGFSGEIGLEPMALQKQLFVQWHQWKDGTIDSPKLQLSRRPIRLQFEATLQQVVDLGSVRNGLRPCAPVSNSCNAKKPCGLFWITPATHPPITPPKEHCASRSSSAKSALVSSPQTVPSAAAGCSRSPPPCGNRACISGSSWSSPRSPIIAVV